MALLFPSARGMLGTIAVIKQDREMSLSHFLDGVEACPGS